MSDLYVAPDAHDDPTIWQRTSSAPGDRAVLTRTATNAPAFDALAATLAPAHVGADILWLCNPMDRHRYDTHDYCLVHEVPVGIDQPCPETLRRLHLYRQGA